jgi:kynureninase
VDFAVGCTYKYLNGGPGSPAFAYVAPRHMPHIQQPLSGWMGHAKPFDFAHDYEKAAGIEQLLCGTPSIVSMSIVDAALAVFEDVEMAQIREKSILLNRFFQECVERQMADKGLAASDLSLACHNDAAERGSQISFQHEHAYALCQALIGQGVVGDFRAPNILRLGFSPLFLSFNDILTAAATLVISLESKAYLDKKYAKRNAVT